MNLQIKLHNNNLENSKEVIERLVTENLKTKLDNYLKQYDKKDDAEWVLELKLEKNKKDRFDGVLQANLDGDSFRYAREDYKNLDDLVNHLFEHFKEELSNK